MMAPARFLLIFLLIVCISAKKHRLRVSDDDRRYIALSTFGFYQGGVLEVKLSNFLLPVDDVDGTYGFTLDRTKNDAMRPYLDSHMESCPLNVPLGDESPHHPDVVYFKMNFNALKMEVRCGTNIEAFHLYPNRSQIPGQRKKRQFFLMLRRRRRDDPSGQSINEILNIKESLSTTCSTITVPITKETRNNFNIFNTTFAIYMASPKEEGFYNLYFHNCPNTVSPLLNFVVDIYESNDGNFLSAGDMPLPALYTMMSMLFALSAFFWTFIICTSRHPVYRIHILMCILVFLKALSLALHGVNFHFLQVRGEHVPAWAILYYITHLFKGALLFITIVLVGTGWNFIKHILADRDKKLFMIVIPLQVIANVAEIIIDESEEGAVQYNAWSYTFILLDLMCCTTIIFPIIWSIKHLQDASTTDGKALINLRKLKLFKHFYLMVFCYIYSTRMIAYVLKKIFAFQYSWLDEMFKGMATFVFFVLTGYKFRPASANPYFSTTSADYTKPQVVFECAVYDGLSKVSKTKRSDSISEDNQPLMQEMSHDYD
ncbi:protein GPR107 [Arctopsyche grandis]|uniref:protein GPR107 n=1 Tax=Arctopsyche grandis TaxID=121162 RepID=UPI00406D8548